MERGGDALLAIPAPLHDVEMTYEEESLKLL
jgi:hypothetical protein